MVLSCNENVLCCLRRRNLSFICRIVGRISGSRVNAGLVSKLQVEFQASHAFLATVTSISLNKTFNKFQNTFQILLLIIIIIIILKRILSS